QQVSTTEPVPSWNLIAAVTSEGTREEESQKATLPDDLIIRRKGGEEDKQPETERETEAVNFETQVAKQSSKNTDEVAAAATEASAMLFFDHTSSKSSTCVSTSEPNKTRDHGASASSVASSFLADLLLRAAPAPEEK
ncbi:unnamed protein product, partial [Amoebophrya sp. A25]